MTVDSSSLETVAADVARAMGIPPQDRENHDVLFLIRCGVELANRMPASAAHSDRLILEWVRLVDPSANDDLIRTLRDRIGQGEPDWLSVMSSEAKRGLTPELLLLGLLRLLPHVAAEAKPGWDYIDGARTALGADRETVSNLTGWLTGSADADVVSSIEDYLDGLVRGCAAAASVINGARGQLEANREGSTEPASFLEKRTRILAKLADADGMLGALNVDRTPLRRLSQYLESDRFRLAVLGEFNRGKSTLINALVGVPDLMPTDILPCTSSLTEIRGSALRSFEVKRGGALGAFEPSDADAFKSGAGAAAGSHSTREQAQAHAEKLAYWRVRVQSPFLDDNSVSLIDSPGLGEDYARDWIARSEAERADAALLVFDFDQIASLAELELIDQMKSKAADLIIVVNKADPETEPDWERVRKHALKKIRSRTDAIGPEQIHFVSALWAENALRSGTLDDPSLGRVHSLRETARRHLMQRAGPIKVRVLRDKVERFARETLDAINGQLATLRKHMAELDNLAEAHKRSAAQYKMAGMAIKSAVKTIQAADGPATELWAKLAEDLPGLLESFEETKDTWVSLKNPVFSPKKHVVDVAERAKAALLDEFALWMRNTGGPLLSESLNRRYDETEEKLEALKHYLANATGRDPERILSSLRMEVYEEAFSIGLINPDAGVAALPIIGGGVLAVVVGYIIADLVLYYLLGIVSGFFNPVLLAAAIALAVAVHFGMGDGWVRAWIRSKVFAKIRTKMIDDDDARKTLKDAMRTACTDIFAKLAETFRHKIGELLDELRYQQVASERNLEEQVQRIGSSPEAVRETLSQYEARVEEMKALLEDVRAAAGAAAVP